MRTATALSTVTLALLATACGSSAPTVCGDAVPQQQVFVGERKQITPCFENPGGGDLTLTQASSNVEVVQAFLVGSNVGFAGVSVGEATITVTAANADNQSVDLTFSVLVPNRAPEYISTVTEATVVANRSIQWNLMDFFTEPDGQEMTFSATSSNSGAAGVTVTDSIAVVSGLSGGESQITLTAADPLGEEGTGTVNVTVQTPVTVFEDDFDSEDSLDDWTLNDQADASVEDGALRIRSNTEQQYGFASRDVSELTGFILDLRMMPVPGGQTGVVWSTGASSGHEFYLFVTGELAINGNPVTWVVAYIEGNNPWTVAFSDNSDLVETDVFQNYVVSMTGDNLHISVGGRTLLDDTFEDGSSEMVDLNLLGAGAFSEYDRVRLSGFTNADRSAKPRIAGPTLDRILTLPVMDLPVKR